MSSNYSYFFCGACKQWKNEEDSVQVTKGYTVDGHRFWVMCKDCALKLLARKKVLRNGVSKP